MTKPLLVLTCTKVTERNGTSVSTVTSPMELELDGTETITVATNKVGGLSLSVWGPRTKVMFDDVLGVKLAPPAKVVRS